MRWLHCFRLTGLPGWMRCGHFPGAAGWYGHWPCCPCSPWTRPPSPEEDREWLSAWAKALEEELATVKRRLDELTKEKE